MILEIITILAFLITTYGIAVYRCRKVYTADAAMIRKHYQNQLNEYLNKDDWIPLEHYIPRKVDFYLVLAAGSGSYHSRVHKAIWSAYYKSFIDDHGSPVGFIITHWQPISAKPKSGKEAK